jgi:cytochrome bd-type quinol oxidase subunit 2
MILELLADAIFDIADGSKDRRAPRLMRFAALGLLAANIAFVSMIVTAVDGRFLAASAAFAVSAILSAATAAAVVKALWIAIPDERKPKRAFLWSLLAIGIVVAIPAPLVLAAAGILMLTDRRRRSAKKPDVKP